MTPDLPLDPPPDGLDDRGRRAARSVHDALSATPVPDFDPDAHRISLHGPVDLGPGRRRWAMGGVAAALLLVVGAVALVATRGDGGGPADRAGTGEVRRFVAGALPDGFELVDAVEAPGDGAVDGLAVELYGPAPHDPRAALALVPAAVDGVDFAPEGREGWKEAAFGDRAGYEMSDPDLGWYGVAVAVAGQEIMIFGDEGDRAALAQVAAAVEVDAGQVVLPRSGRPDGWKALGPLADLRVLFPPFGAWGGSGSFAAYRRTGPPVLSPGFALEILAVTTRPGGPAQMAAVALFPLPGLTVEEVTVRGRPGLLAHTWWGADASEMEAWTVSWSERDGEIVSVGALGASRADVLAVAEGVRPVDDEEWQALVVASLRAFAGAEEGVVLGEGTFSDGSPWVLAAVRYPSFAGGSEGESESGATDGGTGESGGTAGGPESEADRWQAVVRTTADRQGGTVHGYSFGYASGGDDRAEGAFGSGVSMTTVGARGWAYGLVDPSAATVDLVARDGTLLVSVDVLRGGDHAGWVVELPPGREDREVVARAADGRELDRATLDAGGDGPITDPGPTTTLLSAASPG